MKKFLSSILALTLCVGAVGFPVNVAVADDGDSTPVQPTTAVDTFKMAEGASISITGAQGIRFRVEIGDDVVETAKAADDFGFLVFPQVYLATAVANVTAGTAENYHDKFDGELVENQVPADKAGTYGLFDYAEVSLSDEDLENAVYTDFDNGLQYVNVVMTDGVAENRDVELAAIAWYKTGENYTYADFNADFSRSITYVAQQEYIAGNYSRDGLKKAFPWLTSKAFEINSGADMKELALASQTETFEGFTFKLTKTVAVGSDYVPVAETFAGTFDYNNYALLLIDNANKPFAIEEDAGEEKYNVEAKTGTYRYLRGYKNLTSKLFDASKGTINALPKGSAISYPTETPVATAEDASSLAHYVNYTGATMAITIPSSTTGNTYASLQSDSWLTPSFNAGGDPTHESCYMYDAMKELYSTVKLRIYVEATANGLNVSDSYLGLLSVFGYKNNKNYFPRGYWMEFSYEIDEFIRICINRDGNANLKGADLLPLGRLSVNGNAAEMKIYFGDVVFA